MGLGLIVRGVSPKLPRDPADALEQIGAWAQEQCAGTLRAARLGQDDHAIPYLALSFHPAAEPVQLLFTPAGHLQAAAKTSTVGPGYHRYVCAALHLLSHEFGVDWLPPPSDGSFGDETGYFRSGDWPHLQEQMRSWLGAVARLLAEQSRAGDHRFKLNLPASLGFAQDSPILTPLGPRSLEWLARVVADPGAGIDLFPWWNALQDAQYRLGLAKCLMWTEVRWRPPLDDAERSLLDEVNRHLEKAYAEDSALDYPWREWQELLRHRGEPSDLLPIIVRKAELAAEGPKIGYRRGPVEFFLPGGWSIQAPGRFAEGWDDEQAAWTAHDGERHIFITTYTLTDDAGRPRPAADLLETAEGLDQGEGVPDETFTWEDGPHLGRATLRRQVDEDEEEPHWALAATTVVPGRLAVCTVSFEKESDRDWAVAIWRSLKHQEAPTVETLTPEEG